MRSLATVGWLSAILRSLVVLSVCCGALAWLVQTGRALLADLAAAGLAALVDVSFESLVVGMAATLLSLAVAVLAVSACLAALEGLVCTIAGRRVSALTRVSRSSGPAWWRRVVLLLCGASICVCVETTAAYSAQRDPTEVCQVSCPDISGLSLPDLPVRRTLPPAPQSDDRRTVVVEAGDCLWDIARRELGPRVSDSAVAARVDAWYARNRATLGPDPDLIFPGMQLKRPEVQR